MSKYYITSRDANQATAPLWGRGSGDGPFCQRAQESAHYLADESSAGVSTKAPRS